MEKGRKMRKCALLAVLMLILAGVTAGCAEKKKTEEVSKSSSDKAMGRYVEEELNLPDDIGLIEDVEVMEDGAIWVATPYYIFSSEDSGKTWEELYEVDELFTEVQEDTEEQYNYVKDITINKNKDIAITLTKNFDGEGTYYWFDCVLYRDKEGNVRQILEDQDSRMSNMVSDIMFDGQGNLLTEVTMKGIFHISAETGEVLHVFKEGEDNYGIGVCSNILIAFFNATEVQYFDLDTGKPLEADTVLTNQMTPHLKWGNALPVLFDGDGQEMLICNREGIFSHTFGGNVMEQLVDASLCTLGDTTYGYRGFVKGKDNSFYAAKTAAGENNQIATELYRYSYNPDIPTVPDEILNIYALDDYPELKQAALLYQAEHPEVRVEIQSIMDDIGQNSSSSDGYLDLRRADALKTLNTEIMAGKGPDILVLDHMPVNAYMEKGILEDISGIIKGQGLLPNIVEASTGQDGKLYSIPARIRIPVLFGDKELLEKGTGLAELAGTIGEAGKRLGSDETIYPYFTDRELTDIFLRAYTYQWLNEDGTLKEEAVRAFMEQLSLIRNSDKEEKNSQRGTFGSNSPYEKGIGLSLIPVYLEQSKLTFGELCSPALLEQIESMARELPGLKWECMDQASFNPWMTLGISAKASNKERAEEFLSYLFGEEAQRLQQGNGFSVKESVLASDDYWGIEKKEDASLPKSTMGFEETQPGRALEMYSITEEQLKRIREILETVSAPHNLEMQVKMLIKDEAEAYLKEKETLDEAMGNLMDKINLYLSE